MIKKIKNKKGAIQIYIIVGLIAGLITIFSALGIINLKNSVASIIGSGQYIERPVFKYVKCEAISDLKYSQSYILSSSSEWLLKPTSTNYYNVKVKVESESFGYANRIKYSVCNSMVESSSNCRIYDYKTGIVHKGDILDINNVKSNEYVLLEYQKGLLGIWKSASGLSYQIGFIPYGLREYDVLSGSSSSINPNSCDISIYSSKNDYIKSEDLSKLNTVSPKSNENIFQIEEVRWYVSGYLTSLAESFLLTYKNQEAWCRSTGTTAEIYKVNKVVLGSGTYKIASADWSDKLGNENCCPKSISGDKICNNNFQWEQITGTQCGTFKSCGSPNFVPYSENQIIKYSCINGYCQSEIKDVQCASDYDCRDANQICDLNSWTCVEADVNLRGQKIETIPDNPTECEAKGGTWKTKETTKKPFLGIGKTEIIAEEYCDMGGLNWGKIILVLVIIFVGSFILFKFILPYALPFIRKILPI